MAGIAVCGSMVVEAVLVIFNLQININTIYIYIKKERKILELIYISLAE